MDIGQQNKSADEMSWTNQELEIWVKAGLVPTHLLDPANHIDLINFLRINKEKLHACYQRNPEEDYYQMQVPPPNEWHNTPDIPVIDTRTGKVLYSLEMAGEFELCEGVCLRIKAKELEDWKKETAEAKELTAEQNKELKAFLSKYGTERPLSRKEIVTFLEEVRKPRKVQKYRQSGHLVDEKLKYSKPSQAATLFDLISPDTKQKIEESKIEVKAEGIKLTPPENKIVHALNRILHENSQTRNAKAEDFYSGNAPSLLVPYGQNQEQKAAVLRFKPSELYKAYMGKDDYSGADITFINNTLHQLEAKKSLNKI